MKKPRRRIRRNSVVRMVFVGIALLTQLLWILLRIQWLNAYSQRIAAVTGILALLAVLKLNSKDINTAMKMPWIMLILSFPVMGVVLYLLFETADAPGVRKKLQRVRTRLEQPTPDSARQAFAHLEARDLTAANHCRYLWKHCGYPVYENTRVTYYPQPKLALEDMKEALEAAERFIFLEYFIVEEESAFRELETILTDKARQGVTVRLMYDDIGSVGRTDPDFSRRLKAAGVACVPFNPARPVLNLFMNHRDHRKITVIDGRVGFTGGYNLAEEYFDRCRPYGHWKDTGVRLEGEGVQALTAAFLELWSVQCGLEENPGRWLAPAPAVPARGFVQPFADDPLGPERVAENVYLNLISQADRTLYLMTPYLIITDEMTRALTLAARRGVDVRIITPGIPDKRTVYAVTRSYYAGLVKGGVRIYEYTPGFLHAKQCICDGDTAVIGTSNLDYRSLYHHFENNVLLIGCDAVADMAADFAETLSQSREVTEQYRAARRGFTALWQCILRLFAPLM